MLHELGLCLVHDCGVRDGFLLVGTHIVHSATGERASFVLPVQPQRPGAKREEIEAGATHYTSHAARSAVTYASRCGIESLLAITDVEDDDGNAVLAADDLWILESWAEVQRLGFDEALGFTVDDLVLYEEMVTQLFQAEAQMLLPRLKGVDPARAAEMIERGLPIVNAFLTGLHRAKIRNFLASIG